MSLERTLRCKSAATSRKTRSPARVPEGIVKGFEVVDVDHDDAQRGPVTCGASEFALQGFLQVTAVEEPW